MCKKHKSQDKSLLILPDNPRCIENFFPKERLRLQIYHNKPKVTSSMSAPNLGQPPSSRPPHPIRTRLASHQPKPGSSYVPLSLSLSLFLPLSRARFPSGPLQQTCCIHRRTLPAYPADLFRGLIGPVCPACICAVLTGEDYRHDRTGFRRRSGGQLRTVVARFVYHTSPAEPQSSSLFPKKNCIKYC